MHLSGRMFKTSGRTFVFETGGRVFETQTQTQMSNFSFFLFSFFFLNKLQNIMFVYILNFEYHNLIRYDVSQLPINQSKRNWSSAYARHAAQEKLYSLSKPPNSQAYINMVSVSQSPQLTRL